MTTCADIGISEIVNNVKTDAGDAEENGHEEEDAERMVDLQVLLFDRRC